MEKSKEKTAVYLNGRLVGFHEDGSALTASLREKRRSGIISRQSNFAYFPRERSLYINTDSGRARRPYIVVDKGKSRLAPEVGEKLRKKEVSWDYLITNGIIEYLDAEEEENAFVATREEELTDEHTHLEIDPVSIVGVTVAQLPFPEYNSSPRITMACAMSKQSLGHYASNFNIRMDSRAHLLYYPQVPLVQTRPYRTLKFSKRPCGQNFVVAVATYYGYNMGDAIVINRNAIDRALARSVFYKTYETEERRYPGGQKDKFEIPQPTVAGYREEAMYAKLGEDGIIFPEAEVQAKDVLVGKTSPPRFLEEVSGFGIAEEKKRENSSVLKEGEEGFVDSVLLTESPSGNKLVKVKVRSVKIPETGDKFASRHGQKGVIGLLANQEDLPFTEHGVVPDLIINPHAIPSRMTAGHILEMLGGKAASMHGKIMDGTAFNGDKEETFSKILESYGFKSDGKERLYDGISGEAIEAEIFVGVVYYQKLHHLVSNKMHVRSRGPVQLLTHQPTEGRAREGGLRFGEMERDCLIGHGASMLLKERMLEESDKTTELICSKCGSVAVTDHIRNKSYCPLCGEADELYHIEISYAFKLLLDEIKAIGVFPRIMLKDKA
ncbi:MAG: DNA-directed RNA polymerase subunit B' [Candidatus Fermentimicrarchaeum limneticum]|uniref:DNA-directed RNA polymerase subunit beta n=1 Tax=Fermentimicrarchaeum limneticum TaxID=2795018 RepID=A0A7D5XPW7_FERL1|nr:MAG: DNA-directed RNA polymerase subunit B' [Candidatus Fermentimicrarchaeum limneticum]